LLSVAPAKNKRVNGRFGAGRSAALVKHIYIYVADREPNCRGDGLGLHCYLDRPAVGDRVGCQQPPLLGNYGQLRSVSRPGLAADTT